MRIGWFLVCMLTAGSATYEAYKHEYEWVVLGAFSVFLICMDEIARKIK